MDRAQSAAAVIAQAVKRWKSERDPSPGRRSIRHGAMSRLLSRSCERLERGDEVPGMDEHQARTIRFP